MSGVEQGLDEIDMLVADNWAECIVEAEAFRHIADHPACLGYCMASSGCAVCGNCDWQLSGRMDDVGEARSARFAFAALATIGLAFRVFALLQFGAHDTVDEIRARFGISYGLASGRALESEDK